MSHDIIDFLLCLSGRFSIQSPQGGDALVGGAEAVGELFEVQVCGFGVAGAEAGEEDVLVGLPFFLGLVVEEQGEWVGEGPS